MPTTTTACLGRTLRGLFVLLVLLVLLPGGAADPFPTALPVADTTAIGGNSAGYTGTIPTEARAGTTATLQRTSGRSSFRDGSRIHAECMAAVPLTFRANSPSQGGKLTKVTTCDLYNNDFIGIIPTGETNTLRSDSTSPKPH